MQTNTEFMWHHYQHGAIKCDECAAQLNIDSDFEIFLTEINVYHSVLSAYGCLQTCSLRSKQKQVQYGSMVAYAYLSTHFHL